MIRLLLDYLLVIMLYDDSSKILDNLRLLVFFSCIKKFKIYLFGYNFFDRLFGYN